MEQVKVAGTVILNQEDGHKKFLVKKENSQVEFVMTKVDNEYTSLACILNEFRDEVHLDTSSMELVELTSVYFGELKMPLFVFSLDEDKDDLNIEENVFSWEDPKTLREVLKNFEISGVPYLS
ncbi:hypothetical protein DOK76_02525 [Vagococcus sp. DIV0080]|uniref:Group-specific protein n=1 Tax=Candidatus Vagococcus giribetii TaxID=2230876 RepID=A0ABS3HQA3_9ENTE|nr:hypothetical protein [Vagococcus sp. DIV0080]MBO0475929.1 hypothetical protein [Vagococcus sp. DIV0080]